MTALAGLLTAMVTPFQPDGRVDEYAVVAMGRHLLAHGSDGLVVCERIRQQAHPPVIVLMTGVTEPARLRRADECGTFLLLQKPLTQQTVLDAMSRARRQRWSEGSGMQIGA